MLKRGRRADIGRRRRDRERDARERWCERCRRMRRDRVGTPGVVLLGRQEHSRVARQVGAFADTCDQATVLAESAAAVVVYALTRIHARSRPMSIRVASFKSWTWSLKVNLLERGRVNRTAGLPRLGAVARCEMVGFVRRRFRDSRPQAGNRALSVEF